MNINPQDSAFAFVDNLSSSYQDNEVHYGLTKREYFAATVTVPEQVLLDVLARDIYASEDKRLKNIAAVEAKYKVFLADALIQELNK